MRRLRPTDPRILLAGITVLSLGIRLLGLGARLAHQDEARVASWTLHYVAVDAWQYRPIIHGPFLPHVNGVLFEVLGASDFTMRLVVAIVGGLLPATAWLLRDRLADRELIFLGALLALNPVLVYYSRFMRNDVLVAAFAFATFALLVRSIDTDRSRYLLLAGIAFGLALTTKENALLYPVTWAGALVLVLDRRLLLARYREVGWYGVLRGVLATSLRGLWRFRRGIVGGVVLGAVVVVSFYAPKPAFYEALAEPTRLPGVLESATIGTWEEFVDLWGDTGMQEHSYVAFLLDLLEVIAVGGLSTAGFAVVGFLADRYGAGGPRDIVAVTFFWGLLSLLGYPIVADIKAGWTAVHVLVPLAVPAAVGLSALFGRALTAHRDDDRRARAVAAIVLLVAASVTVGAGIWVNVAVPADDRNPVVQYAQPAGDMKPTLDAIETVAADNEGVDVMFYGEEFYAPNETESGASLDIDTGAYTGFFNRLPLPWYLERMDVRLGSTEDPAVLEAHDPPVVITLREDADDIDWRLEDSRELEHQGYLYDRPVVFFIEE